MATVTTARGGGSILCSHHEPFTRHRFLSLHPPRPLLHRHPSKPTSTFLTHSKPIGPILKLTAPRAADTSSVPTTGDKAIVTDDQFSLAKVSFGAIGLVGGITLLGYGFGAYFNILPGSEWSALMLTYGFPLAIIGMAFKYAELKPVPCLTYLDAQQLRETAATPILIQVRNDVTRYRYGDEQHLDEALKRIFQYGQGGGIARRSAPVLQRIREEVC
ncbi:hypothetical protein ABKV19_010280 [Rosa sericea]